MEQINLKKVIKAHGFTLDMVAQRLGVSKSAVSQIVSGNPTLSKLLEISEATGIPLPELVRPENQPPTATITCPHCGQEIRLEAR